MVLGFQRWRTLLFLHWAVEPSRLRALLPAGLSLDTFEGTALVGLVPFTMRGVRLRGLPPLPTARAFHEVNVRTYVQAHGVRGVYFLSLDASSTVAALGARAATPLPYHRARMRLERRGHRVEYASTRLFPGPPASLALAWQIGATLGEAAPGTLEHFVVERYALFCATRRGTLYRARVEHRPYVLKRATLERLDETLVAAAGLDRSPSPASVLFSDGVDVALHGPTRAAAPLGKVAASAEGA